MNMSKHTMLILKNFSGINKHMRINSGNVLTIFNLNFPLFARAEVEDFFPKTLSIYDLNQWLSTLSLFEDPDIEYADKLMTISSGKMSAKYRYCSPSVTADQPINPPSVEDTLFSFNLNKEQLAEILKASSVLGLKEVEFSSNGIRCLNSDDAGNAIDNEYVTAIEQLNLESDMSKPVKIKVEALKLLSLDYDVSVTERFVKFSSEESKLDYYAGIIVK